MSTTAKPVNPHLGSSSFNNLMFVGLCVIVIAILGALILFAKWSTVLLLSMLLTAVVCDKISRSMKNIPRSKHVGLLAPVSIVLLTYCLLTATLYALNFFGHFSVSYSWTALGYYGMLSSVFGVFLYTFEHAL